MALKRSKLKTAFDIIKVSSRAVRDNLTNQPTGQQEQDQQPLFFLVDTQRFTRIMHYINPELSANQVSTIFNILDTKNRKILGRIL
jgi:hypothetical protein